MLEHILVFLAAFAQIALISFNTLNIVRRKMILAFFTSVGVSLSWAVGMTHVAGDPFEFIFAFAFGAALGTSFVIFIDKKL